MLKKILILTTTAIILLIVILTLLFSLGIFTNDATNSVKNEILFYEKNYTLDPLDYRVKVDTTKDYEIVGLSDNWKTPLKRVYSIVYNEYTDSSGRSVAVFEVIRDNIFDNEWSYKEYKMNQVTGISYSDTINLVNKYDITTDFPSKDNYIITNYPPLSQEQIEENKKKQEQRKTEEDELQERIWLYENGTPEQKLEIVQLRLKSWQYALDQAIATDNQYPIENFQKEVDRYTKEEQELKKIIDEKR